MVYLIHLFITHYLFIFFVYLFIHLFDYNDYCLYMFLFVNFVFNYISFYYFILLLLFFKGPFYHG